MKVLILLAIILVVFATAGCEDWMMGMYLSSREGQCDPEKCNSYCASDVRVLQDCDETTCVVTKRDDCEEYACEMYEGEPICTVAAKCETPKDCWRAMGELSCNGDTAYGYQCTDEKFCIQTEMECAGYCRGDVHKCKPYSEASPMAGGTCDCGLGSIV